MTTIEQARKAAEVAQRHPGWHVWTDSSGGPVATRASGRQAPAGDGAPAQTLMADDWGDLERQLAAEAQNDARRAREARA